MQRVAGALDARAISSRDGKWQQTQSRTDGIDDQQGTSFEICFMMSQHRDEHRRDARRTNILSANLHDTRPLRLSRRKHRSKIQGRE